MRRIPGWFLEGVLLLWALMSGLGVVAGGSQLWLATPVGPGRWGHGLQLGLALACLAVLARRPQWRVWLQIPVFAALCQALFDLVGYYRLLGDGRLSSRLPLPFSACVFTVLLVVGLQLRPGTVARRSAARWSRRLLAWPLRCLGALAALLALLMCFGNTDYRRPADCALVLGAGVRADGSASLALSDRVMQAVELYQQGLVGHLVMTGGIDPRGHSEPRVMRDLACAAGVPREAILLDEAGRNTRASALNCRILMQEQGLKSALLVSHDYHLARCRAAFRREGIRCYTVPCRETRRLQKAWYYLMRECAAYIYYALPFRVDD